MVAGSAAASLRIGVFCPSYGEVGGIGNIAASLANSFAGAGHRVTVIGRSPVTTPQPFAAVRVVAVPFHQLPRRWSHVARHLRFARTYRTAMWTMREALRLHGVDVLLTLAISPYAPFALGLRRVGPVVVGLQGGEPDGTFTAHPSVLRRALEGSVAIVACARSLARDAETLAPAIASRVHVIPNGVDPERFAGAVATAAGRPYILAVGRLVPQKGFDVLVDAFVRLGDSGVDLVIAGEGPERDRLAADATRLGVADRVRLPGSVTGRDLVALYRNAHLVACPSRWEGLPLVCLEAMASGRPLVATRVDGIPDAVVDGETGLLVPPDDAPALAEALGRLLADAPRARAMGAAGHARIRASFSWAAIARRYLAVFHEAAGV